MKKTLAITCVLVVILFLPKVIFAATDTDGDGYSDDTEKILGTNPNKADSDGDGKNDKAEITAETNPWGSDPYVPTALTFNGSFKIQANGPVSLYVMSSQHQPSDGYLANATGKYVWGIPYNLYSDYCTSSDYGKDFILSNDATINEECGPGHLFISQITNTETYASNFPTDKPWKIFVFPRTNASPESMYQVFVKDETSNLVAFMEKGRKIKDIPDQPYTLSYKLSCGLTVSGFPDFSPAREAGLKVGDFVTGVNNVKFSKDNLPDIKNLSEGIPLTLNTERGDVIVTPRRDPTDGILRLGMMDVVLTEGCINDESTVEKHTNDTNDTSEITSGKSFLEEEKLLVKKIDKNLTRRLGGKILLQTESRGEAWYVDGKSGKKFYLKDGETAYTALRTFGLGITNADLQKIPIGIESRATARDSDGDGLGDKLEEALGTDPSRIDSDGDGYTDGAELQSNYNPAGSGRLPTVAAFANRLKGRILLQVESRGEAWYINPVDGKRYYMADGESAYQIMRFLSLGITNQNLRKIEVGEFSN